MSVPAGRDITGNISLLSGSKFAAEAVICIGGLILMAGGMEEYLY